MPLPKLPEPVIAERRYFARIEEPLALTMEHDTEALGTDNLDHVVGQALRFIFERNTQFESWLEQHPYPTTKLTQSKATFTRTASQGGAL